MNDENKEKIIKAGALPLYVKLLSLDKFGDSTQTEAAHGLWMLAFKCKVNIINEPACLYG